MSEQEESNLSIEVPGSSSEVSGTVTKKKKKKKVQERAEVDNEFIGDFDDGKIQKQSKKSKKKKGTKSQSARSKGSSAVDHENETPKKKKKKKKSRSDDDMNQENDDEYADNFNAQSNYYNNDARENNRNEMRPPHQMMEETVNMYPRDYQEEGQFLPYSGSTMDSSMVSSKRYNDRGGNNGHPPPMHMESHNENGFMDYDNGDYMSEMGNMDPVDGYNQDYDMSEDDEEEPRFKYSTADLDNGDCRNTRCCLIAAGIFFVLIAILVSVFMQRMMNNNSRRLLTSIRNLRGAIEEKPGYA